MKRSAPRTRRSAEPSERLLRAGKTLALRIFAQVLELAHPIYSNDMKENLLRRLPQVEKALQWAEMDPLIALHSRLEVVKALRSVLERLRSVILKGKVSDEHAEDLCARHTIVRLVQQALATRQLPAYRRAINGTGIVLHTGLGRAVLPPRAVEAFQENLAGYSVVEIDVDSGERNEREAPLRRLFRELTAAPAATVVNNNAAATLLILAAFARGKEVIISRGQLVEIGGSFRIPDILRESGARLVEVGTTNRTYLSDYERAITPETGLLLKVHTSNYVIQGFSHTTALSELVALGRKHGIPVVSDLGSGCVVDISPFGFRREPLVAESVRDGADLVCFSGDKLLGGPQAGIIVGSEESVARVRKHPLFRTLRVDKVTLTLLEATLRLHLDPERAVRQIPALRALSASADSIRLRAETFKRRFLESGAQGFDADLVETTSEMGSGSLPAQGIPSWALALRHGKLSAVELAEALRASRPPVFSRIREDRLLIDFRTVLPGDEADLRRILGEIANRDISTRSEDRKPAVASQREEIARNDA